MKLVELPLKCRLCSKFRSRHEFVINPVAGYCWYCHEWHEHAQELLTGRAIPRGCQECGKTHEQLEHLGNTCDVRYGLHPRDGVYSLLGVACGCDALYVAKRDDVYGNTPWAAMKKAA